MQTTITVYVEISSMPNKIIIATIYRSLKSQATALYEKIKSLIQNKQAMIIGNFNCPSIDWTSMNGDRVGNRFI